MFTLTYTPDAWRKADNILPIGQNRYESRPGFFQVVADNINRAISWNDACVMEIFGGVYVWHGFIFEKINDNRQEALNADLRFYGSRFQALQSLGNREERIYVGNGSTLYYLHRNVIEGAEVTGVEVTPQELELTIGTKETLTAIIKPSWALNKTVFWESSNQSVATIDEDGVVLAKTEGSATLTATTEDGSFTDTCTLGSVPYVAVTGVTLADDEITLLIEDTIKPEYTVEPDNATNQDVYWRSDNPAVAIVSLFGTVTAIGEGETLIHIYTTDGHFTDSCTVTVLLEEEEEPESLFKTKKNDPVFRTTQTDPAPEKFYEGVFFNNEFEDAEGEPYPLPKANFIATWRNRLWAGDGTHIIYHCLNDNPHHWEPLDAIPIQGGQQSEVTGLCPMGNRLIVSTPQSLWQIVGDSPYNWEFQAIVHGHGAINERAMATDGLRLYYLDVQGVYEMGKPAPLSAAIEDLFYSPDYNAQLILDAKGEYLYTLIQGRLFALHTYSGEWGEIIPPYESDYAIKGLIMVSGSPGWYGDRGLWLQNAKYTPDVWMDGTQQPVQSTIRTWPVQPNPYGQASLNRVYMGIEGRFAGTVTYRVYRDINSEALAEQVFTPWQTPPPNILIQEDPFEILYHEQSERVYLEAPLAVAWHQFEHEMQFTGYSRLHGFEPVYQFSERATQ